MRRSLWVALVAATVSIAVAGSVFAFHGPAPGEVTPVLLARGRLSEEVKVNFGDIKIQTKGPVDVATLQVTFAKGGGSAGWHIHPGPVFVVLQSGALSVWTEDCEKTVYDASVPGGSTFFEMGPEASMLVKNESATTDAVVIGTFIVPPGAAPLTITTAHLCGIEE
jgi:quercetin dioxygenase-like cupin family protein